MSLNRVLLQGRLTADPELKTIGKDSRGEEIRVATLRMAVDRDRKNKDGEREADFFTVNAWRGAADFVGQYFAKGDPIIIDGRLQYRAWSDDNGNKRSAVEVVAENIYFGGPKNGGGQTNASSNAAADDDGELPF